MVSIGVEVKGLQRLIKKFDKLGKGDIVEETIYDAAHIAEGHAKSMCPVDTGELLNSIFLQIEKDSFILGATAKHAVFNEYGSIYTPIGGVNSPIPAKYSGYRPFLRPALIETQREISGIFRKRFGLVMHG